MQLIDKDKCINAGGEAACFSVFCMIMGITTCRGVENYNILLDGLVSRSYKRIREGTGVKSQ